MSLRLALCLILASISTLQGCKLDILTPTNFTCAEPVKKSAKEILPYCKSTRSDHVYWASSEAPMAHAFDKPGLLVELTRTFSSIVAQAKRKRVDYHLTTECKDFYLNFREWKRIGGLSHRYVTDEQTQWVRTAFVAAQRDGLSLPKSTCFTGVEIGVNTVESLSLFDLMTRFSSALMDTSKRLREQAEKGKTYFDHILNCWKGMFSHMDGDAKAGVFQCRVLAVAAFRRNGRFGIPVAFTSDPQKDHLREGERQYVVEEWGVTDDGRITSFPLPSYLRGQSNVTMKKTNSTTLQTIWGGRVHINHFGTIRTERVAAMRLIQDESEQITNNVLDTVTTSNIAILLFPIALTLVPISCFELVTTKSVVLYALMTDVLTVLPIAIKGIELLILGRRTHIGCAAYTVGAEGTPNELAIAEAWCASCNSRKEFSIYGAVFLWTSVFFLVVGIIGEVVAFRSLRKRIRNIDRLKPWRWQRAHIRKATGTASFESSCTECGCRTSISDSSTYSAKMWK